MTPRVVCGDDLDDDESTMDQSPGAQHQNDGIDRDEREQSVNHALWILHRRLAEGDLQLNNQYAVKRGLGEMEGDAKDFDVEIAMIIRWEWRPDIERQHGDGDE